MNRPRHWNRNSNVGPRLAGAALISSLALAAGCSSYHTETHYFVALDEQNKPVNYFRLVVTSSSTLASSRFVSGYFDEQAVDQYFSEMKQPTNARFPGAAGRDASGDGDDSTTDRLAESPGGVQPADPCLKGKKLVLLMSSNSDAIASGIGAIADGKEISGLVQALVSKDKAKEAADASVALQSQTNSAEVFKTFGEELITAEKLKTDAVTDGAVAKQNALIVVNKLASMLGATEQFTTFDQADRWLRANRAKVVEE